MKLKLGNLHNLDTPLQTFVRAARRIAVCTNNYRGVFPSQHLDNPKPSHPIFIERSQLVSVCQTRGLHCSGCGALLAGNMLRTSRDNDLREIRPLRQISPPRRGHANILVPQPPTPMRPTSSTSAADLSTLGKSDAKTTTPACKNDNAGRVFRDRSHGLRPFAAFP
jgi:hypothetical protein